MKAIDLNVSRKTLIGITWFIVNCLFVKNVNCFSDPEDDDHEKSFYEEIQTDNEYEITVRNYRFVVL